MKNAVSEKVKEFSIFEGKCLGTCCDYGNRKNLLVKCYESNDAGAIKAFIYENGMDGISIEVKNQTLL